MVASEGGAHGGAEVLGDVVTSDPPTCAPAQRSNHVRGIGLRSDHDHPTAGIAPVSPVTATGKGGRVDDGEIGREPFQGVAQVCLARQCRPAAVLGSNPRISKSSFISVPDPVAALKGVVGRGGTVTFVNPLRIEPDLGETVQVRPDTDPYLLAAMLHHIDRTVGFDPCRG